MAQGTIVKAYRGPVGTLPTLEAGQLGFTTDTNDLYIGDGVTNHKIGGLPTTGGTMSGDINMGNQDISYLKLLKLNGEINDGNSGTAKVIDWNMGAAHKSTLTGNVTLAFTGIGATLIPAMTSNTAPSGEASNSQSSTDAYLSFDAGQNTYSESRPTSGQWIKYAFPQGVSKTPIAYRLQWYDNSHSCASWSFQASNNNVDWTTLDTKTAQSPGGTLNTYTFSNTTAYRYFRFLSSSNGQGFDPVLCTFEIAEGTIDPTSPCFLTLKLVQDATGGRTVTWPATVKGTPAINLAANSVSNVLLYWDGTYYWVLNGKQFASATDKLIGRSTAGAGELEEIACTAAGRALLDDANAAAQLATLGAAAAADVSAKLAKAGDTMTGNLIMDNMDITLVKLLTLHGEIDDGNSGTAKVIDWNTGAAHKVTLTGNVTLAFTGYGPNLVPDMTANNAPSGVASASSEAFPAWYAFDRLVGNNRWWPTDGATPSWLKYQFTVATVVSAFSVVPFYAGGMFNPTALKLSGSDDDAAWTELASFTGLTTGWSQDVYRYFDAANTHAYLYYKLDIPSGVYGGITELGLHDGVVNPIAPCFLTLKLVQDATGGRKVTWPANVKGSPVINQAANAVSNVLFYWDGTSYWTLNGLPWVGVPAFANSAGFIGQMAYDASYVYVCTAANTWKRVAIATW